MSISQILKNELLSKGASLVGFADLRELPSHQRNDLQYGVVIAVALSPTIISGIANGPTQEYFAEYNRVNHNLDQLVSFAGSFLKDRGYQAIEKTTTEVVVEDHSLRSILPHKTVATRAGIGWIGKCALLVTEQYGSAIRISSLLTNAPLDTGTPINDSRCGDCLICTESCPTGAPRGENWTVARPRETFFDAFACRKYAKARAAQAGIDRTICGKCIQVCPWTQRYLKQHGFCE